MAKRKKWKRANNDLQNLIFSDNKLKYIVSFITALFILQMKDTMSELVIYFNTNVKYMDIGKLKTLQTFWKKI